MDFAENHYYKINRILLMRWTIIATRNFMKNQLKRKNKIYLHTHTHIYRLIIPRLHGRLCVFFFYAFCTVHDYGHFASREHITRLTVPIALVLRSSIINRDFNPDKRRCSSRLLWHRVATRYVLSKLRNVMSPFHKQLLTGSTIGIAYKYEERVQLVAHKSPRAYQGN